jgi:hypothetical protein
MKHLELTLENLLIGKCGTTLALLAILSIIGWMLSGGALAQRAAANLPPELDVPCRSEHTATATQPAPPQSARNDAPRNLALLIFDGVRLTDYDGTLEVSGHASAKEWEWRTNASVREWPKLITTRPPRLPDRRDFRRDRQADLP